MLRHPASTRSSAQFLHGSHGLTLQSNGPHFAPAIEGCCVSQSALPMSRTLRLLLRLLFRLLQPNQGPPFLTVGGEVDQHGQFTFPP
jgi:hypothetical protein